MAANEYTGLDELHEHPVYGGQANVDFFIEQEAINVFCRQVLRFALMKHLQDSQPGERCPKAGLAQRLRDAGVTTEDRAMLLGHATTTMTEHYAEPTVERLGGDGEQGAVHAIRRQSGVW